VKCQRRRRCLRGFPFFRCHLPAFHVFRGALALRFKNLNHGVQKCCIKYRPACTLLHGKRGEGEGVVKVRRARFEIVADILQACLLPRGKTRIMCKVRLNFPQANEYLDQLVSLGLLSKKKGKYKTTEKGRQFISTYNHLSGMIGLPELPLNGIKAFSFLGSAKRRF
jgi:predicted transcriptional regulator